MLVKNVRPVAVEIPNVGEAEAGGTIEVPDELGASLCEQPANWEPAKPSKNTSAAADKEV